MTNDSPAHLIVIKRNGKYGCRDCDYVTPYEKWKTKKQDVARHWNDTHHPPEEEPTQMKLSELLEEYLQARERLQIEVRKIGRGAREGHRGEVEAEEALRRCADQLDEFVPEE
jgi:hypothetical protein